MLKFVRKYIKPIKIILTFASKFPEIRDIGKNKNKNRINLSAIVLFCSESFNKGILIGCGGRI